MRVQPEMGGILHLRLNMGGRPIAHKYRKGKMQRTLKREFKELEVVEREAIAVSEGCQHVGVHFLPKVNPFKGNYPILLYKLASVILV